MHVKTGKALGVKLSVNFCLAKHFASKAPKSVDQRVLCNSEISALKLRKKFGRAFFQNLNVIITFYPHKIFRRTWVHNSVNEGNLLFMSTKLLRWFMKSASIYLGTRFLSFGHFLFVYYKVTFYEWENQATGSFRNKNHLKAFVDYGYRFFFWLNTRYLNWLVGVNQ